MATILFYGKPGCANNKRQKELLRLAGHEVADHNIFTHPWSKEELQSYFKVTKYTRWFNPNAPAIKKGTLAPESFTPATAVEAMIKDPGLIKRPLMVIDKEGQPNGRIYLQGFDQERLHELIGLDHKTGELERYNQLRNQDIVTCHQNEDGECG